MITYVFNKELYSKVALLKAAYNYTDKAFIHLDIDGDHYVVNIEIKDGEAPITEKEFVNEMLTQSIRHEVYLQTKNIRELLFARAMATTLAADMDLPDDDMEEDTFTEDDILKDWFSTHDEA